MLYVISGCSGGGESTLVDALASRGFSISKEPGRQIVREELDTGGHALPWKDPVAFSEKCAALSVHRYTAATEAGADLPVIITQADCSKSTVLANKGHIDTLRLVSLYAYHYPFRRPSRFRKDNCF